MKKFILVSLLLASAASAQAVERTAAVGIITGTYAGVSAKYMLGRAAGVDAVFTVINKNESYLHADYLIHDYKIFPKIEDGELPLYYGAGAAIWTKGDFGIRGVIGAEYLFKDNPFALFIEIAPTFITTNGADFSFLGGFGARYFFS